MPDNETRDYRFYKRLRALLKRPAIKSRVYADRPMNRLESRIFGAFAKVASNQYMHSLAGSTERLARTRDYELADISSSLISTALNVVADDCTTYNEDGRVIKITADDSKIKSILYDLFNDRLNVDYNLWHWIRNFCKYGDFFLMLDVIENEGITTFMPLPTVEIEREEAYDGDINSVRYRWNTASAATFENWQIAHFRMIGDDTFLPYGKSMLESGRRIWKQLNLIEDAMLVYRIQRAPERRIFKIDIGNMPPNDIPAYMNKAKDILKRSPIVGEDGKIDLRYNVHSPVHKDSVIPLLDSRNITIEQLAKEYDEGKTNWVYSVQDITHKIVPGKVKWCGKNYTANKIVKITLDDDSIVKVAPEHPMMLRDGAFIRADKLNVNDSLMPLYCKLSEKEKIKNYQQVYDASINKDVFVHQIVAEEVLSEQKMLAKNSVDWTKNNNLVIHHKVLGSKLNNEPNNLQWMGNCNHWKLHQHIVETQPELTVERNKRLNLARKMGLKYNGTLLHKEHNKIRSIAMKKMWNDFDKRNIACQNMKNKWSDEMTKYIGSKISDTKINSSGSYNLVELSLLLNGDENFIKLWSELNSRKCHLHRKNLQLQNICIEARKNDNRKTPKRKGTSHWQTNYWANKGFSEEEAKKKVSEIQRKNNKKKILNHKVKNIEIIDEIVDVYCMEVVGANGENDRHNFAIASNIKNTGIFSGVFVKNSEEDYFLPIRGRETGTDISTLPGAQNLGDIDDVRYVRDCLRGDTKIKLLNGKSVTIKELVDTNSKDWVMSINPKTLQPEPAQIICGEKTRLNAQLIRVSLDNNTFVDCTSNHQFMMRDGSFKQAQDLKENDSLMPYYSKISNYKENYLDGYEMMYSPFNSRWEYTHQIVAKTKYPTLNSKRNIIHHTNFDKLDNSWNNLLYFENGKTHQYFHAQLNKIKCNFTGSKNPKYRHDISIEKIIEKAKTCSNWSELSQKVNDTSNVVAERIKQAGYKTKAEFVKLHMPNFNGRKLRSLGFDAYNVSLNDIKKSIVAHNFTHLGELASYFKITCRYTNNLIKQQYDDIHKLRIDALNITIEQIIDLFRNKFNIFEILRLTGLTSIELKYLIKNYYKDLNDLKINNKIPLRNAWNKNKKGLQIAWNKGLKKSVTMNHKVIKVEMLQETEDTYDIQVSNNSNFALDNGVFVHNSLIAALGIPRAYLTYDEALSSKSVLSQEDVRFSRTIQRIQKLAISELNKIAMIHLYSLGYTDPDDLTGFHIHLTNPSTISEQMKLELLSARTTAFMSAIQSVGVDREWGQKHILRLSDDEVKKINLGVMRDSKFNAEVQSIAQQVQQANAPSQPGTPSAGAGQSGGTEPLPVGQPPTDQIPGGQAVPATPPTSGQQQGIFKNSPDNPMSMTHPKKKDVREDDELEDRPAAITDLFDPTDKKDNELIKVAKKYDFLNRTLSERSKISNEVNAIFIKLDKRFNKTKEENL